MLGVLVGLFSDFIFKVVDAGADVALFALSDEVGELVGMAGGLPDQWVHKDAAIQPNNIVPHLDVCAPPCVLYIVFQLHAKGAIVVAACQATVDFAGLIYEPASFAQGHNVFKFCQFSHDFQISFFSQIH